MVDVSERQITFEVSEELYQKMCEAQVAYAVPSLADFARQALEEKLEQLEKRQAYRRELGRLRQGIREAGGLKALGLGETKEEIIESLRRTRQEIFEEEYAHLYR
ncbi:MAG: hypothetical protein H8D78_04155 [Chloroflexi bacterium]|nr:hypothetical protein [Chloroflexota bacterium]